MAAFLFGFIFPRTDHGLIFPYFSENVRVFILNTNHCDQCIEVVQALAALLMETGYIHCDVDIFAPMKDKCQGLTRWTQEMIFNSDYVIIPWMCEMNPPKESKYVTLII